VSDQQKQAVIRFYEEGMKHLDLDALLSVMTDDVTWFGVDGGFNRTTYDGKDAVGQYMKATFDQFKEGFFFTLRTVLEGPDMVITEWTNRAPLKAGGEYRNLGATVFTFVPGTDQIRDIRQYFDFTPLAAQSNWRERVQRVAETNEAGRG
jgi:ketosteroid isomerase-like protein